MGSISLITSPILIQFFIFFFMFLYILQKTMASSSSSASNPADPTEGFISLPLNKSNFNVQSPYDVPADQRYKFFNGVHRLWVFKTDKPYAHTIKTNPRTEIRISGYDYSSGVWQFEGYGFVPNGTSGVRIMQVFGLTPHSTTFMLRLYNGSLSYNKNMSVLVSNLYDRWFRLNVIHDVRDRIFLVYVDGFWVLEAPAAAAVRGGLNLHYFFKFGVYAQDDDSSYCMESRWKYIKVLRKSV